MSCSQTASSDEDELAYPLEDDQAPHIEKLSAKFNAHFLRDQQGGLDIWINILSHELLPSLQNQIASEYPAHGPGRTICRAWRQNLYLRRVMTTSNVKAVEAAVDVFHEVRELLRKQVEHNLYRIRESATSELVQRTLCDILAINLGNRIGVGERLEDFRLEHSGGVSLNVGCSDPVHLPLIQLVMDARFQFDMPVTEGSCPPCWFPRSMQSSDKAQSKKAPSFYFVEPNVSNAITEEIRNDERSNMGEEDFRRVFYGLRQGFHPRSLIPVDETWKCSLRLFQLIRGYRSDAKFDTCFLQNMYEKVKEDLRDTVRRNLQSLTGWRLGDPVHHLIILNILTLSLSAAIFIQLPDGQEIAGSLESLGRSADDMVKLFIQGSGGRAVVVEEKLERIPFLWTGHGAVLTTCLVVESDLLPPYWFIKPSFVPIPMDLKYLQ